jgi:hypothetical protein
MTKNFSREAVVVAILQTKGNAETPGSTAVTVVSKDESGNVVAAKGITVPGAEAGFAKSCMFVDTDVANGTHSLYENIGDATTANFDLLGTSSTSDIENLAVTAAKLANTLDLAGKTVTVDELLTNSNVGTLGTGVTAVEKGDGVHHVTVLTLTNVDLGAIAGAAAEATGALIYTFPAGSHIHTVTTLSVGVVGDVGVQADTPDLGIGSVVGSGANATLNAVGSTSEDYVTGQTMTDANGTPTNFGPTGATAGVLTDISLNHPAAVKTMYLNIADTWAAASAALLASGVVIIEWTTLT